jgi:ectoine hydroxylase-related dioxygenase (phytanoyl-CoA dioxygenase family)
MLAAETLETHVTRIAREGYTVVEDAVDPLFAGALYDDLLRIECELGVRPSQNRFEGARTVRIYNLLAHGPLYERIPVHENVLPIVERVLDRGCLVSSLSSIAIMPGEIEQPVHADDQLIPVPKPHVAFVCNTMWALTDFTGDNGGTRVIPGSHLRDHSPVYGKAYDAGAVEMRRGSVLVYHGSLWHGGGANRTKERRVGIAMNYCAGFIRQQENQQLGIARDVVRRFAPRLRELVGYGVYAGLIGHIDKNSPARLLDTEPGQTPMIWELDPI